MFWCIIVIISESVLSMDIPSTGPTSLRSEADDLADIPEDEDNGDY